MILLHTGASNFGRTSRTSSSMRREFSKASSASGSAPCCTREDATFPESPAAWRADWLQAGLIEWPIDGTIAILAADLASLHKDPADRFIAATAIVHRATLMTADERLLEWQHPVRRHHAG